jgi:hypothetical protein
MESLGHVGHLEGGHRALLEHPSWLQTGEAASAPIRQGEVPFPLPRIDQIINSTVGCELLSFLDAYSGYHQIKMKEFDQLATSFITLFGTYCYVTMPFGLKNTRATY